MWLAPIALGATTTGDFMWVDKQQTLPCPECSEEKTKLDSRLLNINSEELRFFYSCRDCYEKEWREIHKIWIEEHGESPYPEQPPPDRIRANSIWQSTHAVVAT